MGNRQSSGSLKSPVSLPARLTKEETGLSCDVSVVPPYFVFNVLVAEDTFMDTTPIVIDCRPIAAHHAYHIRGSHSWNVEEQPIVPGPLLRSSTAKLVILIGSPLPSSSPSLQRANTNKSLQEDGQRGQTRLSPDVQAVMAAMKGSSPKEVWVLEGGLDSEPPSNKRAGGGLEFHTRFAAICTSRIQLPHPPATLCPVDFSAEAAAAAAPVEGERENLTEGELSPPRKICAVVRDADRGFRGATCSTISASLPSHAGGEAFKEKEESGAAAWSSGRVPGRYWAAGSGSSSSLLSSGPLEEGQGQGQGRRRARKLSRPETGFESESREFLRKSSSLLTSRFPTEVIPSGRDGRGFGLFICSSGLMSKERDCLALLDISTVVMLEAPEVATGGREFAALSPKEVPAPGEEDETEEKNDTKDGAHGATTRSVKFMSMPWVSAKASMPFLLPLLSEHERHSQRVLLVDATGEEGEGDGCAAALVASALFVAASSGFSTGSPDLDRAISYLNAIRPGSRQTLERDQVKDDLKAGSRVVSSERQFGRRRPSLRGM
uniref:Rhodanese domain-containing protein n=1 Tax=Chromera velia CCMP2878 TaxID=1169474 RepID=A0A0G4IE96_9ALVE|eukprot:Cvel_13646.t1-p1 / transcript=Cvel_13646.t1 / gene=Cvel_13646 / organism=Chromera_velia_CCMP2878 / gene_product=hypothetical protein / transcript_product=hypothetical protein / location=Cvel_scaffold941:7153-11103(+) / protein_length=548 / sequence_SO=supercontig / SO=protein_coding / is_pseudo=false